jgi:hypothetical protein
LGADSSLLVSPANVKLGCCELLLPLVTLDEDEPAADEPPDEDDLSSIHGTTTCFPLAEELVDELSPVLEDDVPGVALLDPELLLPLKETTANSTRPEYGFMMVSLIVPTWLPDDPLICAPVSWLPRTASCPIRPVALR